MCHIHQTHTPRVTGETHSVWMRDGRAEDATPRAILRPRLNAHHSLDPTLIYLFFFLHLIDYLFIYSPPNSLWGKNHYEV